MVPLGKQQENGSGICAHSEMPGFLAGTGVWTVKKPISLAGHHLVPEKGVKMTRPGTFEGQSCLWSQRYLRSTPSTRPWMAT